MSKARILSKKFALMMLSCLMIVSAVMGVTFMKPVKAEAADMYFGNFSITGGTVTYDTARIQIGGGVGEQGTSMGGWKYEDVDTLIVNFTEAGTFRFSKAIDVSESMISIAPIVYPTQAGSSYDNFQGFEYFINLGDVTNTAGWAGNFVTIRPKFNYDAYYMAAGHSLYAGLYFCHSGTPETYSNQFSHAGTCFGNGSVAMLRNYGVIDTAVVTSPNTIESGVIQAGGAGVIAELGDPTVNPQLKDGEAYYWKGLAGTKTYVEVKVTGACAFAITKIGNYDLTDANSNAYKEIEEETVNKVYAVNGATVSAVKAYPNEALKDISADFYGAYKGVYAQLEEGQSIRITDFDMSGAVGYTSHSNAVNSAGAFPIYNDVQTRKSILELAFVPSRLNQGVSVDNFDVDRVHIEISDGINVFSIIAHRGFFAEANNNPADTMGYLTFLYNGNQITNEAGTSQTNAWLGCQYDGYNSNFEFRPSDLCLRVYYNAENNYFGVAHGGGGCRGVGEATGFDATKTSVKIYCTDYANENATAGLVLISANNEAMNSTSIADAADIDVAEVCNGLLTMGTGAEVRYDLDGYTGIRFATNINVTKKANLDFLLDIGAIDSYSFGTIIAPLDYLTGNDNPTHATLTENQYYDIVSSYDGGSFFKAALVKIKADNYDREWIARGYIKVVIDEVETYYYADYNADNARSIYELAKADYALYEAEEILLLEEDIEFLETVINHVEAN